jgi:hypothetical protein
MDCPSLATPVQSAWFSPAGIPSSIPLPDRNRAVFPAIHTPYDYYYLFFLNA